jgi:hypothetical protein
MMSFLGPGACLGSGTCEIRTLNPTSAPRIARERTPLEIVRGAPQIG